MSSPCGWCLTGQHPRCVGDTFAWASGGKPWICTCPTCNPATNQGDPQS